MLTSKDLKVKDVMSGPPHLIEEASTVADAIRLVSERGLTGAPVVGDDGVLRSVFSSTDIVRALAPWAAGDEAADQSPSALLRRGIGAIVGPSVLTCDEELALPEACKRMVENRVHRLVVVREGKPIGVVSAIDVVRAIACIDSLSIEPYSEGA